MPENKPAHGSARRTVTVKPWDYEPTEEELNEEFQIDATPEQVARSLFGAQSDRGFRRLISRNFDHPGQCDLGM